MKPSITLSILAVVLLSIFLGSGAEVFASNTNTRIYAIGSNPFFSWEMYPQDIMQWGGNFIYYYPRYEKTPWWGDIDEANNKPNATTYTTTGNEEINGDHSFEHSGRINSIDNRFGYTHWFGKNLITSIDLDYNVNAMMNDAGGNMTNKDNGTDIPFEYSLHHAVNTLALKGMMGFKVKDVPVGLKLRFAFENTLALNQEFTYGKNGASYSSGRALWGWSTAGCNHIFGPRGTEGDAWLQNEYALGPLFNFALQSGMTLPRIKFGGIFRFIGGHQDQYQWVRDSTTSTGDAVLDRNFVGDYEKSQWSKTTRDGLIQLYGNINWRRGERYALNTFISLDYEGKTFGDALSENLEIESDTKEKERAVAVEFNPNINIRLGEVFHYIDAALLLQYRYSRLNNTYERWVGGGTQETYWDTYVDSLDDEDIWERYSYANQNFIDIGADISAMFPLIKNDVRLLGFGFVLFFDTKFTFQNKYFGTNSDNGTKITFTVANRRENYKREMWFNTSLMLHYMRKPYHIRLEVYEPLLYSLLPGTKVTDDKGDEVFYEHKKQPLWLSQQGFGIALYLSYDMSLRFLKR